MKRLRGPDYRLLPSRKNPRVRRWFRIAEDPGGVRVKEFLDSNHPLMEAVRGDSIRYQHLNAMRDARVAVDGEVFYPQLERRTDGSYVFKLPANYDDQLSGAESPSWYPAAIRRLPRREILARDFMEQVGENLYRIYSSGLRPGVDAGAVKKLNEWFRKRDVKLGNPDLDARFERLRRLAWADNPERFAGAFFEYLFYDPEALKAFLDRYGDVEIDGLHKDGENWLAAGIDRMLSGMLGYPALAVHLYGAIDPKDARNTKVKPMPPAPPDLDRWTGGNEEWLELQKKPTKYPLVPVIGTHINRTHVEDALFANYAHRVSLHETPYVKHPKIRRFLKALKEHRPDVFSRVLKTNVVFSKEGDRLFRFVPGMMRVLTDTYNPYPTGELEFPLSMMMFRDDGSSDIFLMQGDSYHYHQGAKSWTNLDDVPYQIFIHELGHAVDYAGYSLRGASLVESATNRANRRKKLRDRMIKLLDEDFSERLSYIARNRYELPSVILELSLAAPEKARELMDDPLVGEVVREIFGFDPVEVMNAEE